MSNTPFAAALADGRPITWLFTGDSITQALQHTDGRRGYVEHFHERVRGELERLNDCVVNTGVSGSRAGELLAAFDPRVARFSPTVVSVLLGTNDATAGVEGREPFRQNLTAIVAAIRGIGAIPLLHTPPPIDFARARTRADLAAYVRVVREVAQDRVVRLVDHDAHWLDTPPITRESWLADPFHPGARGQLEMAKTLLRELELFDSASALCTLELP